MTTTVGPIAPVTAVAPPRRRPRVATVAGDLIVAEWAPELADGLVPRSPEAEALWLPRVGPTSYLLGCRLAVCAAAATAGTGTFPANIGTLAESLGVGHVGTSAKSPIMRSLDRLIAFGLARVGEDGWTYEIRTRWPASTDQRHSGRAS